jgi:hypothetical protein
LLAALTTPRSSKWFRRREADVPEDRSREDSIRVSGCS